MWTEEFEKDYAVPREITDLVAQGKLIDTSWGNDAAPSFETLDSNWRLWVDHPDPRMREMGSDQPRYQVSLNNVHNTELCECDDLMFHSEDLQAALRVLFELEANEGNDVKCRSCGHVERPDHCVDHSGYNIVAQF
jgi:hypothetical protein